MRRNTRLRRALIPTLLLTALNVPVHPASAAAPISDSTLDARVGRRATLALPIRANLVAVSVPASAEAPELEVRDEDGLWHHLEFEDDHGPDPIEGVAHQTRRFSEPVWVGEIGKLKVRGERRERAVRFHLVSTLGQPADGPVSWLGSVWRALTVPRHADAIVRDQPVVTRAGWGADESWVNGRPGPASDLHVIFVHHTDSGNGYSRSQAPAIVRGIYRYHTKTRGWSDIGYNFLIDRFGTIYEGRGGGIEEPVIGAHARNANTGSSGIALIGNFSNTKPPKRMRMALARLVAWKADVHHMPVVGSTNLSGKRYKRISGHRDANPTACPGSAAYGLLPWLRRAALKYGLPKMYRPRTVSNLLRRDGDGSNEYWRLLSWGSGELNWSLTITDSDGVPIVQRSFSGKKLQTGDRSGLYWYGAGPAGGPVSSGRYSWLLEAQDSNGRPVRSASGGLIVISDHHRGALLADQDGAYVLSGALDGLVAEPLSNLALRTRFRGRAPVPTGPGERARYADPPGTSQGMRLGALLKEQVASTTTLLVATGANEVAPLAPGVATALGYRTAAALPVTTAELTGVTRRAAITETSRHPAGTYVSVTTGTDTSYFRVRSADRIPVTRLGILGRGVAEEVVPATAGDLALPLLGGSEDTPDAVLYRTVKGTYWFIDGGQRRKVVDTQLFTSYGYSLFSAIGNVKAGDIDHLPVGERIE